MDFYEKYNFSRSQTSIKDLEKDLTCPLRWKHQWLLKEIEHEPTLPMLYGHYFESLIIGSGADGEPFDESLLPTNKNGTKKADVVRIEQQAKYCRKMLYEPDHKDYLGIDVKDVQLVITHNEDRIVIDAIGVKKGTDKVIMIDIKLTADVHNDRGPFAWGNVDNMDLLQQGMYQMVFEERYDIPIHRNILLVFDYSPNKGKKVINVNLTDSGKEDVLERKESFNEVITDYESMEEWIAYPSINECKACPLECSSRFSEYPVEYEEVSI